MGAVAGAFAAAATTPLDVIKTQMMCTAASRPSMRLAARHLFRQGGPGPFFRCSLPWMCSNHVEASVRLCRFAESSWLESEAFDSAKGASEKADGDEPALVVTARKALQHSRMAAWSGQLQFTRLAPDS